MSHIQISVHIAAPAADVWSAIGKFSQIGPWIPGVRRWEIEGLRSENIGAVRRLHFQNGAVIREQLFNRSEEERFYTYTMLSGPFPIRNHIAMLSVFENEQKGGTNTDWCATFDAPEAEAEAVESAFTGMFRTGLTRLAHALSGMPVHWRHPMPLPSLQARMGRMARSATARP